jgi:hypothetical protein
MVNRIRRDNPALRRPQSALSDVDNPELICFSEDRGFDERLRRSQSGSAPHSSGWVELPMEDLGLDPHQLFQMRP